MALTVRQDEQNQNIAQAPTLGSTSGEVIGQGIQQRGRNVASGRGSGFTNSQQTNQHRVN